MSNSNETAFPAAPAAPHYPPPTDEELARVAALLALGDPPGVKLVAILASLLDVAAGVAGRYLADHPGGDCPCGCGRVIDATTREEVVGCRALCNMANSVLLSNGLLNHKLDGRLADDLRYLARRLDGLYPPDDDGEPEADEPAVVDAKGGPAGD